jgi:putative two-component system response regulator
MKAMDINVASIMLTSVEDRQTAIDALELGAYGYIIKPFKDNEFLIHVDNALERRRLTLLSQEYEQSLETEVRARTKEVRDREEEIIVRLVSAMGYRDEETGTHARRVGLIAQVISKHLGWEDRLADRLRRSAPIHDLGKIGVPDGVLRKPGKLTDEEFEIVKEHTLIGAQILQDTNIPVLLLAREIALSHHEKWNGSGYPHGLVGEEIPESARIVSLADVYDALTHARVYRPAMPEEKALAIMSDGVGSHFGPRDWECFEQSLPRIREICEELKDEPGGEFNQPIVAKPQQTGEEGSS